METLAFIFHVHYCICYSLTHFTTAIWSWAALFIKDFVKQKFVAVENKITKSGEYESNKYICKPESEVIRCTEEVRVTAQLSV